MELVQDLEDRFDLAIPDSDIKRLAGLSSPGEYQLGTNYNNSRTPRQIVDYVGEKLKYENRFY